MKYIKTEQGLKELLRRYEAAGVKEGTDENGDRWLDTIRGCIKDNLAMDELDYECTPKELKKLWKGLK